MSQRRTAVRAGTAAARRRLGRFALLKSPIMEPRPRQALPDAQDLLGRGIDNPDCDRSLRPDRPRLRAQVIANTHTTHIEQNQTGDVGTYVVFNKSDYRKQGAFFTLRCHRRGNQEAFPTCCARTTW